MSKSKKILLNLVLTILIIFGLCVTAYAYDSVNDITHVGQQIFMTRNEYLSSNNIYCVEHGQVSALNGMYEVVSNVRIEGTKSTDHTGKTIESKDNARFAYILSQDNGDDKASGPVANGIWNFASTWMENVGKYHAGLYSRFCRK